MEDNGWPHKKRFHKEPFEELDRLKAVRIIHIPSGKIFKYDLHGGITPANDSTNTSLPLWILDGSQDFQLIND